MQRREEAPAVCSPRVVLSSFGRFHMYTTAEHLEARDALGGVFTADLKRPPQPISARACRFPVPLSLLARLAGRSRSFQGGASFLWVRFDDWVSRQLPRLAGEGANVFQGFSLTCLRSLQRARAAGMIRIVERAGTHIVAQRREVEHEMRAEAGRESLASSAYYRSAERMVREYEEADTILTCSEYARLSFLEQGFAPEKVVSIPLGANFPATEVDRRPDDPFRVLCVGVDPYIKGVTYLLQAWQKAAMPGAELRLRVQMPDSLRPLADRPGVAILPPMDWGRLREEYRQATVFCLPSVDDGFGMVVLEAMSCGVPAIVSTHVGAAEAVRPGVDGLIFPVRDVDALAACLTEMHQDRQRTLWMGENARQRSQEYSWERYANALMELYRSALSGRGTRNGS